VSVNNTQFGLVRSHSSDSSTSCCSQPLPCFHRGLSAAQAVTVPFQILQGELEGNMLWGCANLFSGLCSTGSTVQSTGLRNNSNHLQQISHCVARKKRLVTSAWGQLERCRKRFCSNWTEDHDGRSIPIVLSVEHNAWHCCHTAIHTHSTPTLTLNCHICLAFCSLMIGSISSVWTKFCFSAISTSLAGASAEGA